MKTALQRLGQQAILDHLESLPQEAKRLLEKQLAAVDFALLAKQREMVLHPTNAKALSFEHFDASAVSGDSIRKQIGFKEISEGRVGCLLLAGGEGTRLGFQGPKGTFPISVIQHKSLFQLVAEKVLAASKQAGRPLPLAIMTSPQNDAATRQFFLDNRLFGLEQGQLSFFSQSQLPYLDREGNLLLESPTKIAEGPDGNGFCFKHLAASGILSDWFSRGIQHLNLIFIDNPLADPFDSELIGFHQMQGAEVTIKCAEKKDPLEKVGVLVKENGMVRVSEYSEMSEEERQERLPSGKLKHGCANLGLFCFSLSFINKICQLGWTEVPLHQAWKAVKNVSHLDGGMAWKFESFLFDWLVKTNRIEALLYPREECFAPLKNAAGSDSQKAVKQALQENDRRVFAQIAGCNPPQRPFELSSEFYYPTPALRAKWKNKPLPDTAYIEP